AHPNGSRERLQGLPGPSEVPGLARRARRSLHAGARAWPLVHGAFVLVPTGPASRGTPNDASGGQGHRILGQRCAPASATNHTSAVLLAHAQTRLTTVVATAWRAAGYSPAWSE